MSDIVIGGKPFPCEATVKTWLEDNRFDARSEFCLAVHGAGPCGPPHGDPGQPPANPSARRYGYRPALRDLGDAFTPEAVQGVIRQCVIHLDGCTSSEMCMDVLHNERGLSCHFLVDNDGTVFQTLDLGYMAYHARGMNPRSVGIELSNLGDANDPKLARLAEQAYGGARRKVTCRIHGQVILSYAFTDAQLSALRLLVKALVLHMPNLPLTYPQERPGQQVWGKLDDDVLASYEGLLVLMW
jgi:hypothetical protein